MSEEVKIHHRWLMVVDKNKVIVSDAAPLIQLSLAHRLDLLPRLYSTVVPGKVFEETQRYPELPDAIEIAKAVGVWLTVRTVTDRKEVNRLIAHKLDDGEAEAIVLYRDIRADSLLTSDRYAARMAAQDAVKVITVGDIVRTAHSAKIIKTAEVVHLLGALVNQDILNTSYIRKLLEEAKRWR